MIAIKVPPLGESIVEATVSRWLKKEGDAVQSGETVVELETDKITVEVPALKAGVLASRAKAEGDVVAVDETLGQLDESAAGAAAGAGTGAAAASTAAGAPPQKQATTAAGSARNQNAAAAAATTPAPAAAGSDAVRSSPAARRVAAEERVELGAVSGTGRGGVVSKPDVIEQTSRAVAPSSAPAAAPTPAPAAQKAPSAPAPAPLRPAAPGERETREKMTTRRKRIAENLLASQHNTAHLTTFNEVDMTAVSALRERLKERIEKEQGVRLSFMPFFVKAACLALKAYPTVNSRIDGDTIVYHHYVNMGIAVASDQGLVVPNVKDADRKGMLEVSRDIAEVAKRARDSKLTMEDLTGGTFTITNGGVFGSLVSTPIINYPQVGILGLHKIQDRPVAVNGKVEIRPMMYVALSYDHRIIDGQQAVLFLVRVKELMEDPGAMLVD
jgi:2-oxoglutarate dehydrogenase E2 component (dihydrolipoamide succinyltransferase)